MVITETKMQSWFGFTKEISSDQGRQNIVLEFMDIPKIWYVDEKTTFWMEIT